MEMKTVLENVVALKKHKHYQVGYQLPAISDFLLLNNTGTSHSMLFLSLSVVGESTALNI